MEDITIKLKLVELNEQKSNLANEIEQCERELKSISNMQARISKEQDEMLKMSPFKQLLTLGRYTRLGNEYAELSAKWDECKNKRDALWSNLHVVEAQIEILEQELSSTAAEAPKETVTQAPTTKIDPIAR